MFDAGSSAEYAFVDVLAVVPVSKDDRGRACRRMGEDEVLPPSVVAPLPEIALSIHLFNANAEPPRECAVQMRDGSLHRRAHRRRQAECCILRINQRREETCIVGNGSEQTES